MTNEQLEQLRRCVDHGRYNPTTAELQKAIAAAIETLAKLPVTADGVLVVPGIAVWVFAANEQTGHLGVYPLKVYAIHGGFVRGSIVELGFGNMPCEPHECYSTRAVAEAAQQEAKP